jgi:hypothetical protein
MPSIGEIKSGREIGSSNTYHKYIWLACPRCKKERWVASYDIKDGQKFCLACSRKIEGERRKNSGSFVGPGHPAWKGGRQITKKGYVVVLIDSSSPYWNMRKSTSTCDGTRAYIFEHRLVMAQELGRCLEPNEKVHHKNGIKSDNRPHNLELIIKSHKTSYEAGYRQGFQDAAQLQNEEQKKQNRLLRWEIKQLREDLQLKLGGGPDHD